MPQMKTIVLWALVPLAALALFAWRASLPPSLTTQVLMLDDASTSTPDDCKSLTAFGRRVLSLPHIRARSTFSLFATTDANPSFIATFKLPTGRISTETRARQLARENAFLEALEQRCLNIPWATRSPIFQ